MQKIKLNGHRIKNFYVCIQFIQFWFPGVEMKAIKLCCESKKSSLMVKESKTSMYAFSSFNFGFLELKWRQVNSVVNPKKQA